MIVGFVIEDNFITTSFIDKDSKPAILKQSLHKDEYELTLILDGNFCYTTKTLENVKLANPKLSIFENIITKPKQKFETTKGAIWNNRQLMAILFKKMIHDLNSSSIHQMTTAHISLPPNCEDELLEDVEKSIKANGVLETKHIEYEQACKHFSANKYKDLNNPVFINLAEEYINIIGNSEESLEGFKSVDTILMDQLLLQTKTSSTREQLFDAIELYLIKAELVKIRENILSNTAREEYHILLRDNYLVFKTPVELIKTCLINKITQLKEISDRLEFKSIVFTGRCAKYQLIQENINTVFLKQEQINVRIDSNNELKAKGILFN